MQRVAATALFNDLWIYVLYIDMSYFLCVHFLFIMKRNFIFLIDFNLEMTFMIDCYDTFVVK